MKRYTKDIVYSVAIILSSLSSFFIDKTEIESNQDALSGEVKEIKAELKQTNLAVIVNRLDNMEDKMKSANDKINKLDEKADRILILLAGGN